MNIAIYDLDKTITCRPTFTHFLLFFAKSEKPFRLIALPIWLTALVGYRLRLYNRKALKQFGIAIFIGRNISGALLDRLAQKFTDEIVLGNLQSGAIASIETDRRNGQLLVMATAAPIFYAKHIGQRLGFDHTIATLHVFLPNDMVSHRIDGENCFSVEKLDRVRQWLETDGIARANCHISVYTDHPSDAPLLDWADHAVLVNPTRSLMLMAQLRNWAWASF